MSAIKGDPVSLSDLTASQKFILGRINDTPDAKYTGSAKKDADYLCSLGLAEYSGGLRYQVKPAGVELHYERIAFLKKVEQEINSKKLLTEGLIEA